MPLPSATSPNVELRERTSLGKLRYDLAKGEVYDVRVLGARSKNGHDYPETTRRAVLPLLEGATVYIDHPKGKGNGRSLRERFARLTGLEDRGDATYAKKLTFNPHHEYAPTFCWLLANDPDGIGLSINARGDTKRVGGRELVERINHVHSVDLVDNPATNKSLFESTMNPDALTDPAGTDTTVSAGSDAKTHLVNAIAALAQSVKDGTASSGDVRKQITDILAMVDAGKDATDDGVGDATDDAELPDDGDDYTEKIVTESLLKLPFKTARWAGRRLLRERRRKQAAKTLPDKAITEAFVADLADADDAKASRMIADRASVVGSVAGPKAFPRDPTKTPDARLREQTQPAAPDKLKEVVAGLLAD